MCTPQDLDTEDPPTSVEPPGAKPPPPPGGSGTPPPGGSGTPPPPRPQGAVPQRGGPGGPDGFSVLCIQADPAALAVYSPGWDDLARCAIEPNAFYEPWNVLPALEAFAPAERPLCVFVYGRPPGLPAGKPLACGFFPLVRRRLHRLAPLAVVQMWKHRYCFLTTPLIRQGCGDRVLDAFFAWLHHAPEGAAVWQLDGASAEGPFAHLLTRAASAGRRPTFVREAYARAAFDVPAELEPYLAEALSGRQRRDLRRRERLLAQRGPVETRILAPGDEVDAWLDDFLRLEALGWKGREGTALAQDAPGARYFRAMARGAFERGQLHLLGLFQDGKPIAMKCNLLAPPGSFAFKIAFDESLAACSPGVLLELANMDHLSRTRPACWMDSCTAGPDHPMIDRLWRQRRAVHTILIATGRAPGDLVVSVLPLVRWLKRKLHRPRPGAPILDKSEEEKP